MVTAAWFRVFFGFAVVAPLLIAPGIVGAVALPGPLVQGDWVKANQGKSELVLLDIQEPEVFLRHHIPGSVNWPYSQWRTNDKANPPSSLLPFDQLAGRLGQLGISADSPVVIVATGTSSGDLSASARVFWTLSVLGHQQVAVLDGGLASYANEHRGAFVSGAERSKRTPVTYQAEPNLGLLADADWIQASDMPRLDARSLGEFVGVTVGPGERPGTLPGAHHLPFDWLTKNSSGRLRDRQDLDRLFAHAGIGDQAAVHFCHTGNRAALTWFVDYAVMGNSEARLYDASMIEWGKNAELPIETRLEM